MFLQSLCVTINVKALFIIFCHSEIYFWIIFNPFQIGSVYDKSQNLTIIHGLSVTCDIHWVRFSSWLKDVTWVRRKDLINLQVCPFIIGVIWNSSETASLHLHSYLHNNSCFTHTNCKWICFVSSKCWFCWQMNVSWYVWKDLLRLQSVCVMDTSQI